MEKMNDRINPLSPEWRKQERKRVVADIAGQMGIPEEEVKKQFMEMVTNRPPPAPGSYADKHGRILEKLREIAAILEE